MGSTVNSNGIVVFPMFRVVITLLVLSSIVCPSFGQKADPEVVDLMATLSQPRWGELRKVQKRWEFLLPRLSKFCSHPQSQIGDMIAITYQELEGAGIDEPFLDLANNLHLITSSIERLMKEKAASCDSQWAAYVMIRREGGYKPEETIQGIITLAQLGKLP